MVLYRKSPQNLTFLPTASPAQLQVHTQTHLPIYIPLNTFNFNPLAPGGKQYYCEVCVKQLNGPKPYQAHMASRAHKEELALRENDP